MEASFPQGTVINTCEREAGFQLHQTANTVRSPPAAGVAALASLCSSRYELNYVITLILSIFMAPRWGTQPLLFQFPVCQVKVWRPQKKIRQHHILHGAVSLSAFRKAGSFSLVQKATGIAAITKDPCTVIKTFDSNTNLAAIRYAVISPLLLSYF